MADVLDILEKKLGIDRDQAASQLAAYVDFIHDRSSSDNGIEVQDLGRFSTFRDIVVFTPEEALADAVNYRYRSLSPLKVELEQAANASSVAVAEPASAEADEGKDVPEEAAVPAEPQESGQPTEAADGGDDAEAMQKATEDESAEALVELSLIHI